MTYWKSIYNAALLTLTKTFCNNDITIDEYKAALSELCTQYRKDKNYGKS